MADWESMEGTGFGAAKRRKTEEKNKEKKVEGRWIPTDALTGIPLDSNSQVYSAVQDDLRHALRHRVDDWNLGEGETRFFTFGQVTVTYTVVEPISDQGSGCTFRTQYVSTCRMVAQ